MTKRTNEEWLTDLRSDGSKKEEALADLRAIVVRGLPYALSKYLSPTDPHFDSLIQETAQETLLRVLDKMDTFEGRSRFTTWVHTIAVRIALSELRRQRWKDISLDDLLDDEDRFPPPRMMSDPKPGPETLSEGADLINRVQRLIEEELTEKQRKAMIAIGIKGMPIAEVARRMDTNRNALYKLMHDARVHLKKRMQEEGISPGDVLAVFDKE